MSQKSKQFDEIDRHLQDAILIIKEVLFDFNQRQNVNAEIAVLQNILQRFYYCIQSVECLLHKFNNDWKFKFPMGLLIRNGLLDFITAAYLYEKGIREKNFADVIAKINHHFVSGEYKFYENQLKSKEITKEKFQEELLFLKSWYPHNFQESDKNGIPKLENVTSITAKGMASKLNPQYRKVHNLYHYYSQYEHFGVFSKVMIDGRPEFDFDKMKVALWYIFLGVILCFENMQMPKDRSHKIDEIRNKIIALPELCKYP